MNGVESTHARDTTARPEKIGIDNDFAKKKKKKKAKCERRENLFENGIRSIRRESSSFANDDCVSLLQNLAVCNVARFLHVETR